MKLTAFLVLAFDAIVVSRSSDTDRFNYRASVENDYGPEDWDKVTCDTLDECHGWPDGWQQSIGWTLKRNQCEWCPHNGDHHCDDDHRQSPINLLRATEDSDFSMYNPCTDDHEMPFEPGTCTWNDIVNNPEARYRNGFLIERHALQIKQPYGVDNELKCEGQQHAQIDFANGFYWPWHLYQTDVKIPSEHRQNGKQYPVEVQLAHHYSVDDDDIEVSTVSLFLDADSDVEPVAFLDKLICQWREVEASVLEECQVDASTVPLYPACNKPSPAPVPERASKFPPGSLCAGYEQEVNFERMCRSCCAIPRSESIYCHANYHLFGADIHQACSECCDPALEVASLAPERSGFPWVDGLCVDVGNPQRMCREGSCCSDPLSESPWCKLIYQTVSYWKLRSACYYCCSTPKFMGFDTSRRLHRSLTNASEEDHIDMVRIGNDEESVTSTSQNAGPTMASRQLSWDEEPYSPYRWLELLHTEFYFRYVGRMTAPPCFFPNDWRIMKDPLLVHPSQVAELERLLAERRAPLGSEFNSCEVDNAGKERHGSGGAVFDFNRQLQSVTMAHDMQFCQCNWESAFSEDLEWCNLPFEERLTNLNVGSHTIGV